MESSKLISTDKATVIIQVNPQVTQNAVINDDGQEAGGSYHNTALREFFKAEPKALGTVQIMTGVKVFLFGIVHTTNKYNYHHPGILIISGITYWGSLVYISAGSLSVAAENKLHPCVVKASLIMNVLGAITAAVAMIMMSKELDWNYRYDTGIVGVLLVFSILQFMVSISISGFACKATCNSDSTVVSVALNQGN